MKLKKILNRIYVRVFGHVPYPYLYEYPKHDGVFCDLIAFFINNTNKN